jgi:hypothetical protein
VRPAVRMAATQPMVLLRISFGSLPHPVRSRRADSTPVRRSAAPSECRLYPSPMGLQRQLVKKGTVHLATEETWRGSYSAWASTASNSLESAVPASVPESPAAAFNAAIHWVPSAQVPLTQRGPTTIPQLETQRWPLNSSTPAGLFATSDLHCARAPALMAALGQLKAHGTQAFPSAIGRQSVLTAHDWSYLEARMLASRQAVASGGAASAAGVAPLLAHPTTAVSSAAAPNAMAVVVRPTAPP